MELGKPCAGKPPARFDEGSEAKAAAQPKCWPPRTLLAYSTRRLSSVSRVMNASTWITWQILAYSIPTWLCFVAIAFCAARFIGWLGVPLGCFVVAVILYVLDVRWVTAAMNAPGWDGAPDMDMIFMFGVLARVILINAVLLPVTAVGLWLRHRSRRCHNEPQVAS